MKNSKALENRTPFDRLGFLLFGLSLAAFFFVIETLNTGVFRGSIVLCIFGVSLFGFLLFYLHYQKVMNPVINLKLFLLHTFRIAALGNLWSRLGLSSISFILPLFFQIGYGLSPLHSGLLICPWALGMITMKFFSTSILIRWGFRKVLSIAALITGLTIASFSCVGEKQINWIVFLMYINGLAASLQFLGMNLLYYTEVSESDMSHATSIASTLQQLSAGLGFTFMALILQFFIGGSYELQSDDPNPFRSTFLVTGAIVSLSIFIFLRLKQADGNELLK
jgi:hypothetical protein